MIETMLAIQHSFSELHRLINNRSMIFSFPNELLHVIKYSTYRILIMRHQKFKRIFFYDDTDFQNISRSHLYKYSIKWTSNQYTPLEFSKDRLNNDEIRKLSERSSSAMKFKEYK